MTKTILVVAAHADDEALGCGGTIARHVAEGDCVHALFMADGVTSRGDECGQLAQRKRAVEKARRILGISNVTYLDFPDNRLDSCALLDVIQCLEKVIDSVSPEIIYTHHYGDLNIDHRITHQAVMTVCRPIPSSSVREIYTFEVMSSTEWATLQQGPFLPSCYVDISDYLEIKVNALEAYAIEMRDAPHSRSIEHLLCLAKHRGQSVGVAAAEAFSVIRVLR